MRWALASIGLLVVIVVFSVAALDQKNVVWQSETPHCPHCRSEVHLYSSTCPECRKPFDWEPRESECTACLSDLDARYYRGIIDDREEAVSALIAETGWPEGTVRDLRVYLDGLRSGGCLFCGGTGRRLDLHHLESAGENGGESARTRRLAEYLEGRCPVCFDTGRCVLCDGDHRVVHARETAARDLDDLVRRLARLDLDREDASEFAFRAIQGYFRRHAGHAEAATAPSFDGISGLTRADVRWAAVRRLLDRLPAGD